MREDKKYRAWTRMDEARLAELVAMHMPREDIAVRLGRSCSAIEARIACLGIAIDTRRPFSASDDRTIREGRRAGAAYAFMTAKEINADIKQKAPGGGPRDTDARARGDKTRKTARDEILAERKKDPAGWAMNDETVAAAFATADEAAASAEPGTPEAEQADRLFRRALALSKQTQKDMGATPRLLSADEREALAEELAEMSPADRLARIGELKRRYGEHFDGLVKELTSDVDGGTRRLAQFAAHPRLADLLAKGMEEARENGPAVPEGASVAALPFVRDEKNGPDRFDNESLGTKYHAGQVFKLPDGSQVLYDGEALVPVAGEVQRDENPDKGLGDTNPQNRKEEFRFVGPGGEGQENDTPAPQPLSTDQGKRTPEAKVTALPGQVERQAIVDDIMSAPVESRARKIAEFYEKYGERVAELFDGISGEFDSDTLLLATRPQDARFSEMLARGIVTGGADFSGAVERELPIDSKGNIIKQRLEDKQLYWYSAGKEVIKLIYDAENDALRPALEKTNDALPRAELLVRARELANVENDPPQGTISLPLAGGKIDRKALKDGQTYLVAGADGTQSAWRWNEDDRAFIPYRGLTRAFSIDGMHELVGIPVQHATDGRPIFNMELDRRNAIVLDQQAVFEVADNLNADDSEPPQGPLVSGFAKATVLEHSATIERLAKEHGVKPDLVKAIMYREQAGGLLQPAADLIGVGKTVSPMGINPSKWRDLGIDRESAHNNEDNIRTAIILIRRIQDRLDDPTPEKVATLYNGLMKEKVSDYGARVGRYFQEKPWLREESDKSQPSDPNFAP